MLLGTFCTLLALNAYADSVGSDYQDFKNSLNKKYQTISSDEVISSVYNERAHWEPQSKYIKAYFVQKVK